MQRGRDLALRSGDRDPHHSNRSGASLSRGHRRSLSERTGPAGQRRPGNADRRIVPGDSPVAGGGIGRGCLVKNLAVGLQSDEGVGESDRDQELAPVLGREFDRDMAAEGRRRAADVDRDVENAAARAAHELVLGEWRRLEVQSAQGADRGRKGMVVLHEGEIKTRLVPVGAVVNLGEKPSGVAVLLRRHDLDRRNCGLFHLHRRTPVLRPTGRAGLLPEPPRAATSNRLGAGELPEQRRNCERQKPTPAGQLVCHKDLKLCYLLRRDSAERNGRNPLK